MSHELSISPFGSALTQVGKNVAADRDTLVKAALYIYLDIRTPQDSTAATFCIMGAPALLSQGDKDAAMGTLGLLEAVKANVPIASEKLAQTISGLKAVKDIIEQMDIHDYTHFSTAAVGLFDPEAFGQEYGNRPQIGGMMLLGLTEPEKEQAQKAMVKALGGLLAEAERIPKIVDISESERPKLTNGNSTKKARAKNLG